MDANKYILGIDIGGSMTKICGFRLCPDGKSELIKPIHIKASDQISSLYGAFGKFTVNNGIELGEIKKIMTTGVGSTFITDSLYSLYGISTENVEEFKCIARGGLYLSGLGRAVVVSMGTGTALVMAEKQAGTVESVYLGGTGVGGGTIAGLSKIILKMDDMNNIVNLATEGDLSKIDLRISDITKKDIIPGMPDYLTASNFGKISDIADKPDIALGILNLVFETIGMMSIFAARRYSVCDIVLTGNLTRISHCRTIFALLGEMFKINFLIPEHAVYGPVIGAALCSEECD